MPGHKDSMKKVMSIIDDAKVEDNKQKRFATKNSHSMILRDIFTDGKQKKRNYAHQETNLPQINIPDD